MEKLDLFLLNRIKNWQKQERICFCCAIIAGIMSHGFIIFNKISYHDDIFSIDDLGGTFTSGRWMLGIIEAIFKNTLGLYSSAMFNAMLALLFVALSSTFIVRLIRIKSSFGAAYVGIIIAIFPAVTSIFAYMFTAWVYLLGIFLATIAALVINNGYEKRRKRYYFLGILFTACSIGIYQANFSWTVSLLMLTLIADILCEKEVNCPNFIRKTVVFLGNLVLGMISYLVINKAFSGVFGTNKYQGMDQIGKLDIRKLPALIKSAYWNLLIDIDWNGINVKPFMKIIVFGIIFFTVLLGIYVIKNEKGINRLFLILLLSVLPIAIDLVYLMSTSEQYRVHTIMRYSAALSFIVTVILLEHSQMADAVQKKALSACCGICIGVMCILSFGYIYLNNAAYLKMNFLQQQTISYYTTLISAIKGTDGYKDEMPVVYIGRNKIVDKTFDNMGENSGYMKCFSDIRITGYNYDMKRMVNDYSFLGYMGMYCGFNPKLGSEEDFMGLSEVKEMPCWPDDGSIKVINDTVVVKFSD